MIIKSITDTDKEMLTNIRQLYLANGEFELDPCYSKGVFYKEISSPLLKYDLLPQDDETIKADCRDLPLADNSIGNIVFDPPFLFRDRPSVNNDKNSNRFTYFKSWEELLDMYNDSLKEFSRILKKGGYLFFKCQDMTDNKFYPTHCKVLDMAIANGFKPEDLGILVAKQRIYHSETTQRHFRKFHSYWWIFKKSLPKETL